MTTTANPSVPVMPFLLFVSRVYAASSSRIDFTQPNIRFSEIYAKEGGPGLGAFIVDISGFLISVTGVIAIVLLLYSGVKRITSAGSSEAVQEAEEIMWAALIGLMIALGSVLFLRTINPDLITLKRIEDYLKANKLTIDNKVGVGVKVFSSQGMSPK